MWQAASLSGLLVTSVILIEMCTTCQVDIVLQSAAQHEAAIEVAVQHESAIEVAVQHGCANLSLHLVFCHSNACEVHNNA